MKTLRWILGFLLTLSTTHAAGEVPAPRKHAAVLSVPAAEIVLDGRLDEAAWATAPDNTGFELGLNRGKRETVPDAVQTHFRVIQDAGTLYLGIRCNDPAMARLRPFESRGAWDPAMWMHDTIELFFDPTGGRSQYYHFAVDPDNAQFDEFCWTNAPFSSLWRTACHKDKDFWSVEVAIPFAALWWTPARDWSTNWTFSISRLVQTHGLATTYSPVNGGFHDPKSFGTLGPISVDTGRFNLRPAEPRLRIVRQPDGGLVAQTTIPVTHAGTAPFQGSLTVAVPGPDGDKPVATAAVDLPAGSQTNVTVEFPVAKEGPGTLFVRIARPDGALETGMRSAVVFNYEPLKIMLVRPAYRNNIYATENVGTIKGTVIVDMPAEQTAGKALRLTLAGNDIEPRVTNVVVSGVENTFRVKADHLPVGAYTLTVDLIPAEGAETTSVARCVTTIRKLAPARDVEARIDDGGNLVVDGRATTVRGWYGGFGNDIANTMAAILPSSCNFNWGAVPGKWCLADLRGTYSDQDAKTDAPMSAETRERLLQVVRATQGRKDVIAYYIAEEPGGFGLTSGYLRKVYDVIAEADPYRIIMMVGGSMGPGTADAVAIQPFGVPLQADDGQRWLGQDLDGIAGMRSGVRQEAAGRTPGKAIWCRMPCYSLPSAEDGRRRNPNLTELRWITFTAILNGVKSLLPHHAGPYETHYSHRVAMDAIFEDLVWLEPVILAQTGPGLTCSDPQIDAMARTRGVHEGLEATVIIAANQSYSNRTVTFRVDSLAQNQNTRILVAREDRVLPVTNGVFTDTFDALAVHIYTTQDVLPSFKTLTELEAEIRRPFDQGRQEGNLLLDPAVSWRVGVNVLPPFLTPDSTADAADLVDGMIDGGWAPWNDDRSQCVIEFAKPVTFSRMTMQTRTIRSAELEILEGKEWRRIGGWQDAYTTHLEWKGASVTTGRVRIRILATRDNWQSSIGELGFYK